MMTWLISPEHYNKAGIETIDALEAMLGDGFEAIIYKVIL